MTQAGADKPTASAFGSDRPIFTASSIAPGCTLGAETEKAILDAGTKKLSTRGLT